jgi:hypothetical protein
MYAFYYLFIAQDISYFMLYWAGFSISIKKLNLFKVKYCKCSHVVWNTKLSKLLKQ